MKKIAAIFLFFPCLAWATYGHVPAPVVVTPPPVVVTPPPVVMPPPTVAPPAATTPAAPPAGAAGHTVPWIGIGVAVGMVVFAWLAICQLEEKRDPDRHKALMCPKTPDWKQCSPFSQAPC